MIDNRRTLVKRFIASGVKKTIKPIPIFSGPRSSLKFKQVTDDSINKTAKQLKSEAETRKGFSTYG